jgi:hypothetical protein
MKEIRMAMMQADEQPATAAKCVSLLARCEAKIVSHSLFCLFFGRIVRAFWEALMMKK